MKLKIYILTLSFCLASIAMADEVVLASEEDLAAFDQMLAPPVVEVQVETKEGSNVAEVPAELVQQRGGFSLIVSDEARQAQPQRGVVPNEVLRGTREKTQPTPHKKPPKKQ